MSCAQTMVSGSARSPARNSARRPCTYPLADAPDDDALPAGSRPGSVASDAPLGRSWLTEALGGEPVLLALGAPVPEGTGLKVLAPEVTEVLARRYLGSARQALYLVRPDQVIAARWQAAEAGDIAAALAAIWGDRA